MDTRPITPIAMRRRLSVGPRSANGRVARLIAIFIDFLRPRQRAGDAGQAHGSEGSDGSHVRMRRCFDDGDLGVADQAGEARGAGDSRVVQLTGSTGEL